MPTELLWNVCVTHKAASVRRELEAMIAQHRPDVIKLQETYHLHGKLGGLGYRVIQGKPKGENAECALLIRNDHQVRSTGTMRMRRSWVGPKEHIKHGPRRYPKALVDIDGHPWKQASVHLPFGAKQQAESLRRIARGLKVTRASRSASYGGDWNLKLTTVLARLRKNVKPIHGKGHGIDGDVVRNARVVSVTNLGKHGSDHDALLIEVEAAKKGTKK